MKALKYILTGWLLVVTPYLSAQALNSLNITTAEKGLMVKNFNGFQQPGYDMPLLSVRLNGTCFSSLDAKPSGNNEVMLHNKLMIKVEDIQPLKSGGFSMKVVLQNTSKDTLTVSNIVPFGESPKQVYLTSWDKGDRLSRAFIFRPGYAPVNVTVPDNAWGMGLGIVDVDNGSSVVSMTRIDKQQSTGVALRRFESIIYPDGKLVSTFWMDSYIGRWQEGFRLMLQKNMLYDIEPGTFDNRMYEREDLKWIKYGFVGHFIWAWHNYFYDVNQQTYTYESFREQAKEYYGGDDNIILWTGFPVLGLDQRNQWDLTRSMPGGVKKLREISDRGLKEGMRLMTNYKPWDLPAASGQVYNSTHYEHPIDGLGRVAQEAGFWGVMFDTRSESGKWFQDGIDKYREGFAIFPEGMCVPVNMQNCLIGRTHAAIEYAPFLNLNKLIKPDFCIYRQLVIEKENPRRDVALSFFSGHGVEFHQYMNVELDWVKELYSFAGRTARILRENADNLFSYQWTPLIPTTVDSIYVNEWPSADKTLYTIYNLRPEGYSGNLFEVTVEEGWHFVDLWKNEELYPQRIGSKFLINASIDPFPAEYLGTRGEASVSAMARFRKLITVSVKDKKINITSPKGSTIRIWHGNPAYNKTPVLETPSGVLNLTNSDIRKAYTGNLVIQLFDGNNLLDQYTIKGTPDKEQLSTEALFSKSKGETSYQSIYMDVELLREKDMLNITQKENSEIVVYLKDMKAYPQKTFSSKNISIKLLDTFGRYEGDFIVLAKQGSRVVDSTSVNMPYGYPRLASQVDGTPKVSSVPEGMVQVPAGKFTFKAKHIGDWMIKHPMEDTAKVFTMKPFYMDKHPVTNKQFKEFMDAARYKPTDPENFLKHWEANQIPLGEENYPVTFVSYEDAKAYAKWAGKRLPTEKEWQYAAQADKGWLYPWGNEPDATKCNIGNGIPDPVGAYPQGANNWGLEELTGSVWQLTNDLYKTATTDYIILKGGSYFTPKSSWWYVTGGALPLINRQQLLRVSQGYERCATVGFRLMKDIED